MRVLILGITGMLGSTLFRILNDESDLDVYGTIRQSESVQYFADISAEKIVEHVSVENPVSVIKALERVQPDVVINCIGVIKQALDVQDPVETIAINAQFPHQLAQLCKRHKCRMVHLSTDCVFSGSKGNYQENDFTDPQDLYGRSKVLGEVAAPHVVTLRTSMIGHELRGNKSLLEWFLSQKTSVRGFEKAIFSGLTTVELSKVIAIILDLEEVSGILHVAADPISKYDLLQLIATVYQKDIAIHPDAELVLNRSLNASRLEALCGYTPPSWDNMIKEMFDFDRKRKYQTQTKEMA